MDRSTRPGTPESGHGAGPDCTPAVRRAGLRPGQPGLPRWLHLLALIAALAAGVLAFPMLSRAAPAAGTAAPDFALKDLRGANQRLSEFRGEIVVLTFWASWCGPCRETLTELRAVDVDQTDRPVVISVNIEGDADRAASVARSLSLDYTTLVDDRQSVGRLYEVSHLPLTLLLDRDGVVRGSWARERVAKDELIAGIRELQRQ